MLAAMAIGISIIYWPVDWFIRGNLIWNTVPYVLLATGMPFLFKLTKDNSLDANIGELSYPIYMCHALIIGLVLWSPLHDVPFIGSARPLKFVTLFLVIVAAFLLDRLVVLPVDKLRVRFGAKKRIEARPILQDLGAISITGTS